MRFLGLLLLVTAGTVWAGEYAVLASGGRLRVDRHEIDGTRVRLYNSTGYIEMPMSNISGFVADEPAPSADVPAPPVAPVTEIAPASPAPSPLELADAAADKY